MLPLCDQGQVDEPWSPPLLTYDNNTSFIRSSSGWSSLIYLFNKYFRGIYCAKHISTGTTDTIPALVKSTVGRVDKLEFDNNRSKSEKVELQTSKWFVPKERYMLSESITASPRATKRLPAVSDAESKDEEALARQAWVYLGGGNPGREVSMCKGLASSRKNHGPQVR